MRVLDALDEISVQIDNMELKVDGVKAEQLEEDDILRLPLRLSPELPVK